MPSVHRLQRGLLGYLTPFAPHAFVLWVSGAFSQAAFAIGVPADINAYHYYTGSSACFFRPLVLKYPTPSLGWAKVFKVRLLKPPRDALRPINPDNVWTTRITATAGTSLVGPYSWCTIKYHPKVEFFFTIKAVYTENSVFLHAASLLHPFGALRKVLDCSLP